MNGCRHTVGAIQIIRLSSNEGTNYATLNIKEDDLLAISTLALLSNVPEFGLTQYFLGAVVLILNITFLSEGFVSFIYEVTGTLKGPETRKKSKCKKINIWIKLNIS